MRLTGVLASAAMLVLLPTSVRAAEPETVYAVGDSITRGDGLEHEAKERYAGQLRDDGLRVQVVAHGGQCLVAPACAYGYRLVDTFQDKVLAFHPDRVVVAIGVNDLAHATDAQMHHAYRLLRKQGKEAGAIVHIATITPTARSLAMYKRSWVEPQRQRINRWIRRTFPNTYLDFAAALEGRGLAMRVVYDGGDGLHPNAHGAEALAAVVAQRLLDGNP